MVLKKYSSQSEEVYFSIGFLGNSVNARNWRANLSNPSICSSLSPSLVNQWLRLIRQYPLPPIV
ncbi:MAG: hypothetical protein IPG24_06795 [Leptospiraceae bacterium]|nr:hypothetical protein [Leptospiraceae bacterium]